MGIDELLQLVPFCVCDTILCFYDDNQMSALEDRHPGAGSLKDSLAPGFCDFLTLSPSQFCYPRIFSSISDQDVLFNFYFYWNVSAFQCCVSLCFTMT